MLDADSVVVSVSVAVLELVFVLLPAASANWMKRNLEGVKIAASSPITSFCGFEATRRENLRRREGTMSLLLLLL